MGRTRGGRSENPGALGWALGAAGGLALLGAWLWRRSAEAAAPPPAPAEAPPGPSAVAPPPDPAGTDDGPGGSWQAQRRTEQRAEQEVRRQAVLARHAAGKALVSTGPVPAAGSDVELGVWIAGVQAHLSAADGARQGVRCPPGREPAAGFENKGLAQAFAALAGWAWATDGGVRAAAVGRPQPAGAWTTIRAASNALKGGRVVGRCVDRV